MANPHGCVCIVDDDDDIREVLQVLLERAGYPVMGAADGAEALVRLRQRDCCCCLILLDLMMPGMSGWEFRAQQMEDPVLAAIPVIILSGAREVAEQARALHAAGFLQKPVDLGDLRRLVERYC